MTKTKDHFGSKARPPQETYEQMLGKLLLTRLMSPYHMIDPPACIGMIEGGADMTIKGPRENDAIMLAGALGLADIVEAAVKKGYRFDEQNKYLETALHATLIGYSEFLMEKGADGEGARDYPRTVKAIMNAPCIRDCDVRLDIKAYGKTSAYQMIENLHNNGVFTGDGQNAGFTKTAGIDAVYADISEGLRHQRHFLKSTAPAPAQKM